MIFMEKYLHIDILIWPRFASGTQLLMGYTIGSGNGSICDNPVHWRLISVARLH